MEIWSLSLALWKINERRSTVHHRTTKGGRVCNINSRLLAQKNHNYNIIIIIILFYAGSSKM